MYTAMIDVKKTKTGQSIKITHTHTNLSIYEVLDYLPYKFTRFAKANILFWVVLTEGSVQCVYPLLC